MTGAVYHTILIVTGIPTLILGIVHFFFPSLFDFRGAIAKDGPPLKPFKLLFIRYNTQRTDASGLVWVMNHAASFTIVTVGILDICCTRWISLPESRIVLLWIAAWWFIRAGSQFYLGRRAGDWAIASAFSLLAIIHLAGAAFL